jgi:hypothetical protein
MTAKNLLATRISTENLQSFDGDVRAVGLGVAQLTHMRYTPLVFRREPVHVRRDDRQSLRIAIMLQGSVVFEHNRTQEKLSAGEMVMHGAWHPFAAYTAADESAISTLALTIPRHAIPFAPSRVDQLLGRRLNAEGTGAILVRFLTDLFTTFDSEALSSTGSGAIRQRGARAVHGNDRSPRRL